MVGHFAKSKAGHDKGHLYIIVREETEYVYVADGEAKLLSQPKKKNKKHIQIAYNRTDQELRNRLLTETKGAVRDEEVKRAIKLYLIEHEQFDKYMEQEIRFRR